MAFHPGDLPTSVQSLFNKNIHAPMLWPAVVQEAVNKGIKDANKLADIVFYLHHPDLIGKSLVPGEANFTKLSEEWKAWKTFVQPAIAGMSKPTESSASSAWRPYTESIYADSSFLPKAVKQWLAQPPTHDREAGLFKSTSLDGARKLMFLAWKTLNTKANCMDHSLHDGEVLHGWLERETSLAAIKQKHSLKTNWLTVLGNDVGAKEISAMNLGMNKLMFHYVFKKGMCVRRAEGTTKRKLHEEAKAIIELVAAVAGAAGFKGGGTREMPFSLDGPLKLPELDWKGFTKQVRDVVTGDYGKSQNIDESVAGLTVHEKVRDGSDAIVGLVRHFD